MSHNFDRPPLVIANLPRTGLGNMLLVWARAVVFAARHELPLATLGWRQVRIGPWLRGERVKRWYGQSFDDGLGEWRRLFAHLSLRRAKRQGRCEFDPDLEQPVADRQVYAFRTVPRGPDYFDGLHDARALLRQRLRGMVRPELAAQVQRMPTPTIAVHVRRGDFKQADVVTRQTRGYQLLTPISDFVTAVREAWKLLGEQASVTVYTDGGAKDVAELLALGRTQLAPAAPDVVDMLQMSRAELLIPCPRSTFSYWSAFLTERRVLRIPYAGIAQVGQHELTLSLDPQRCIPTASLR